VKSLVKVEVALSDLVASAVGLESGVVLESDVVLESPLITDPSGCEGVLFEQANSDPNSRQQAKLSSLYMHPSCCVETAALTRAAPVLPYRAMRCSKDYTGEAERMRVPRL
jgi:hypothetical protein